MAADAARSCAQLSPAARRRLRSIGFGALAAALLLILASALSQNHASPQVIAQHTQQWLKSQTEEVLGPIDAFAHFRQSQNCTLSSLALHRPFAPKCGNRAQLLEAMSGGGRIGWDAPYQTRGCDMNWLSTAEICTTLHKFDRIHVVGDSMMRKMVQTINIYLREDLVDGLKFSWLPADAERDRCNCFKSLDISGCRYSALINTGDLLNGSPESVRCSRSSWPGEVVYSPLMAYPLKDADVDQFLGTIVSSRNSQPNGREVFIFGHGAWNSFSSSVTIRWLQQIEDAMKTRVPAFFTHNSTQALFPRLFLSPTAQQENKPAEWIGRQNNINVMRGTHEVATFVKKHGYDHLAFYNLTVQASSPDGTHASVENNLVKAMMVLNWLQTL